MTSPFQIGNQGGQSRAGQTTLLDRDRHWGFERSLAPITPILGTGMLLNRQGRSLDVDLLHDTGKVGITSQAAITTRARSEEVFLKVCHLLGWKRLPFVLGMSRLAADFTAFAVLRDRDGRRLDDVGRRWFRGIGRILLRGRQLLLETLHIGLQRFDLLGLTFQQPPQLLAL